MNNDKKTTLLGAVLATITAATINPTAFFSGDVEKMIPEIGKLVSAIVIGVLGWYVNKQDKPKE